MSNEGPKKGNGGEITRRKLGKIVAGFLGASIGFGTNAVEGKGKPEKIKKNVPAKIEKEKNENEYFKSENFKEVLDKFKRNKEVLEKNKQENKDYSKHVPKEGKKTELKDANFSIFEEDLKFKPGRMMLVVSDFWQTACLFDAEGKKVTIEVEGEAGIEILPVMFQVGTGKSDSPTELGLYEVDEKMDENYKSATYPLATKEEKKQGKDDGGGEMPWALRLAKVTKFLPEEGLKTTGYTGTAFHGRKSVGEDFTKVRQSHGCVGSNKLIAEFINNFINSKKVKNEKGDIVTENGKGSFVLVVDKGPEEVKNLLNFTENDNDSERNERIQREKAEKAERERYVPDFRRIP